MLDIERVGWNEALHPRAGGKFASKGGGSAPKDSSEGLRFDGKRGAGYGKKGGDNRVHALQTQLNRLGFTDTKGNKLAVDGKLGPRTTAAIKRAQRSLGLKADGVATPALLAKLSQAKGAAKKAAPARAVKKAVPTHKGPARKHVAAKKAAAPPRKTTGSAQHGRMYAQAD